EGPGSEARRCEGREEGRPAMSAEHLNWSDPDAVKAWLVRIYEATEDLAAVPADQSRPLQHRRLGREARNSVRDLLAYATPPEPDRGDSGDCPADPSGSGASPVH